jgi:hypothetical protein
MDDPICEICDEPCSSEVALAHKKSGAFPEVYWPGVRTKSSNKVGHAECLIAAGELEPPLAHKPQWDEWEAAGRPTVKEVDLDWLEETGDA